MAVTPAAKNDAPVAFDDPNDRFESYARIAITLNGILRGSRRRKSARSVQDRGEHHAMLIMSGPLTCRLYGRGFPADPSLE